MLGVVFIAFWVFPTSSNMFENVRDWILFDDTPKIPVALFPVCALLSLRFLPCRYKVIESILCFTGRSDAIAFEKI